jgi:hypothetical protein
MNKTEIYAIVQKYVRAMIHSTVAKRTSLEGATTYALGAMETLLSEVLAGNPLITVQYLEKQIESLRSEQ